MLSIPRSSSDAYLAERGLDLVDEYRRIVEEAKCDGHAPVLELATGSGRMTAVLAHLGYSVWTGDVTDERHSDALRRLTPTHADRVRWMLLDMERLPFKDASVRSIVCMNTLHELDHPLDCVREMVRAIRPDGTLVIGDFNERGFAILEEMERTLRGREHARGSLKIDALLTELQTRYMSVRSIHTPLNTTFIARKRTVREE